MRVLVSGSLDASGIRLLQDNPDVHVEVIAGLSPEELKGTIADEKALEALVSGKVAGTPLDVYEKMQNLPTVKSVTILDL
jgi:hypothetical protein